MAVININANLQSASMGGRLVFLLAYLLLVGAAVDAPGALGSESRTVYFVLLDNSQSMRERPDNPTAPSWLPKIDELKRQLAALIGALPPETEVRVFVFSEELEQGPRATISNEAERKELIQFVDDLQADGRQTRLWRSLDGVLSEAAHVAKARPGVRVRVLAYTDLEDNDPDQTWQSRVLTKYRSLFRQAEVQITYITIGFELLAEQRRGLEQHGLIVCSALSPVDVIPLQAEFRLIPGDKVLVGSPVVVVDDSLGVIRDRVVDWGDGSESSFGRSPEHVYSTPGAYEVELRVTSATGQQSKASRKIHVSLPPDPSADFAISDERVSIGEAVLLVDLSSGHDCEIRWSFGDGRTSSESNPCVRWATAGEFTVQLEVTDRYGRVARAERAVTVEGPPKPVAAIGCSRRVGKDEELWLWDRSRGPIDRWRWLVDGGEVSTDRDCKVRLGTYGTHRVVLEVEGPGGNDRQEVRVEVASPPPPEVRIAGPVETTAGRSVRLLGRISGVFDEAVWFVDGSPAGDGLEVLEWCSGAPGDHQIELHVTGPGGEGAASHVIHVRPVAKPTASFAVGSASPRAGDVIRLVDTSTGSIDVAKWYLPGIEEPRVVDYRRGAERWIEFTFPRGGTADVRLRVEGEGGSAETECTVNVRDRFVRPQAVVKAKVVGSGRDWRMIQFENHSSGSVVATQIDFGDGAKMATVPGTADVRHRYRPGSYEAAVRVIGPDRFVSSPVVMPIDVPVPPPPAWRKHAATWVPAFCLAMALGVIGLRRWNRMQAKRESEMLFGTLQWRRNGATLAPLKTCDLEGHRREAVVEVNHDVRAVVRRCTPSDERA